MRHFYLFGASNLTLTFPKIIAGFERHSQGDFKIFAAHGHGRSYGKWSRVLARSLPSLLESQLWSHLLQHEQPTSQPLALVTDIGNDLVYGRSSEQVLTWLKQLLQQLVNRNAQILLTALPEASLAKLPAWRFYFVKSLFFPGTPLTFQNMQTQFREINAALPKLAQEMGCQLLMPREEWYGFDPIHILPSKRSEALAELFSFWSSIAPFTPEMFDLSWSRTIRLWRLKSLEHTVWGKRTTSEQPCYRSPKGGEVFLF